MNIGDKVRFLTETGGGIVRSFRDKNTVVVETEDGFDIPMLISNVVVVGDTDSMNFERKPSSLKSSKSETTQPKTAQSTPAPAPAAPTAAPSAPKNELPAVTQQLAGHDTLNIHLAFLPVDIKVLSTTLIEAWVVNDTNYHLSFTWASIGSGSNTLLDQVIVPPNSVQFLREFTRDLYAQLEHVSVQILTWKPDRPFLVKPPVDVRLRVDTVKFFKLHTFTDTPFFDEPALLVDVIRGDRPCHPVPVDADRLAEALNGGGEERDHSSRPARIFSNGKSNNGRGTRTDEPIEVDLHIEELVETTTGMSNADILDYQLETFRRVLRENQTRHGQRLIFIHGKGDGTLRAALARELARKTDHYSWQDASFRRYGFGAMLVIVR